MAVGEGHRTDPTERVAAHDHLGQPEPIQDSDDVVRDIVEREGFHRQPDSMIGKVENDCGTGLIETLDIYCSTSSVGPSAVCSFDVTVKSGDPSL